MEIYLESNINLLVRLSKEAHDPITDAKRYVVIAKGISEILNTIAKHHGIECLHYVAYAAQLRLGHTLGPLNASVMDKLIRQGCIVTRVIYA